MPIETLDDWNAILGQCCCEMPACPVPTRECESIEGHARPKGFFNPDDEEWKIYPNKERTTTYSYSESVTTTPGGGQPAYTSLLGAGSGSRTLIWEMVVEAGGMTTAEISVGGGCLSKFATEEFRCDGSATWNQKNYDDSYIQCPPDFSSQQFIDLVTEQTITSEYVGGQDDGAGGTFPHCTFKNTSVVSNTEYCHVCPPDTEGSCDGFPITETSTEITYSDAPGGTWTSSVLGPFVYDGGLALGAWRDQALAIVEAALDFEDGDCARTPTCISKRYYPADPDPGVDYYLPSLTKSRFRWVIPQNWSPGMATPGTYFKITWDVVFFPTTGDPAAVSTDNTWEWTGPGDLEDADSWKSGWYEIPVPEEPGENRVVNIRFECYRSTAFGNKPQVTGEAVEIPPP